MTNSLNVSILSPAEVEREPGLLDEWQRRVELSTNLYRLYQSPLWWDHLLATQGADVLRLLVIRDDAGAIRGLAPCELRAQKVRRYLAGRPLTALRAPGVELLGSQPLVDEQLEVFEAMCIGIWQAFPGTDLCRAKSLPTGGRFWQHLRSSGLARSSCLVTLDGPRRPFYSIQLGDSWDGYLARFTSKQRNDLRRKQRLLSEAADGKSRVRRIDTEALVEECFRDLERVSDRSRLRTVTNRIPLRKLQDAARRGCLRSYLLYADQTPVASVIGYQAFDVFHYSDVRHSPEWGRHSPGTVLLFQIIRDLFEVRPVRWLNFGKGDAEYKRRFSNVTTEDATVYLMRRTVRNRLRVLSLWGFEVLDRVRNVLARRPPREIVRAMRIKTTRAVRRVQIH